MTPAIVFCSFLLGHCLTLTADHVGPSYAACEAKIEVVVKLKNHLVEIGVLPNDMYIEAYKCECN